MTRKYYSSRKTKKELSIDDLYKKTSILFDLYRRKDYFKEKAEITSTLIPDEIKHEAFLALSFQPFPISKWSQEEITKNNIFDTLEFLYDHLSKPGELIDMVNNTGWQYADYGEFDEIEAKKEFRNKLNAFLSDFPPGFFISEEGEILALGENGLSQILDTEIPKYDEGNIDKKIENAIKKWRNRDISFDEKKEAIREIADVFEWLKKTGKLNLVLDKKDESDLFKIANNFAIRHHNPSQKFNYDQKIWYAWMFHIYLATYHAVSRVLLREK